MTSPPYIDRMHGDRCASKDTAFGTSGLPATRYRLLIGPVNSAGQGTQWARAISEQAEDTSGRSFTWIRDGLSFPADYTVDLETYLRGQEWSAAFRETVAAEYTHVIIESNLPVFGRWGRATALENVEFLRASGLAVALLAHGSDVRVPSYHNQLEPWSPFPFLEPGYVSTLESRSRATREFYRSYPGQVFVSTPGLLKFLPDAVWCPVVVEPPRWHSNQTVLQREVPVVVHAPSRSALKGSALIDPILKELDSRGLISYRRVQNVDPVNMPALYGGADIVFDHVGTANYGVAACEAMAAGRIVLSHISPFVRNYVAQQTGVELPVVEATPDTLAQVVQRLLSDREEGRRIAGLGPTFVAAVHDGRRSAAAMRDFLTQPELAFRG